MQQRDYKLTVAVDYRFLEFMEFPANLGLFFQC